MLAEAGTAERRRRDQVFGFHVAAKEIQAG